VKEVAAGRIEVLGVPFDPLGMEEAVKTIASWLEGEECHQIVTANPETVMKAGEDRELMAILREARLVVADGIGIVWAARRQGNPLPERVPGVELAERLVALAAQRGYRVYLLGGAPGVAAEAARCLEAKYPGLVIAGVQHGYFSPEEEEGVVAAVAAARPHLLLVGLGMPKQEKWIYRHRQRLGAAVAIGVGGSLDVFAGRVCRAPGWMCRLGLEWLYRFLTQPQRLFRMLALPRFAVKVLVQGRS